MRNINTLVVVKIHNKGHLLHMSCDGGEEGGAALKFTQSLSRFTFILQSDEN